MFKTILKGLRSRLKIILIYIIVVGVIALFNVWLVSFSMKPKVVVKVKEKIKIEEKIKEVDSNKYYLYEDRYQLVSLIIYNNEFASFDTVTTNLGNDLALAYIFGSHDLNVLYSVERHGNKYYLKDSHAFVMEIIEEGDDLIHRDYKFEPST